MLKMLIPDDDAVSRTLLQSSVEKFGHECLVEEEDLLEEADAALYRAKAGGKYRAERSDQPLI